MGYFFMNIKVGDIFGELTVFDLTAGVRKKGDKKYLAICKCSCGAEHSTERHNLLTGNTTRCQSCARKKRGESNKRHGHSPSAGSKLEVSCYTRWQAMKARCNNPNDTRWLDYGGRGISVCAAWMESYDNFLSDMGLLPSLAHQIDRINNGGNYEPSNCRWALRKENSNNKRNNRVIAAFGESKTLQQWAEFSGVSAPTIARRLGYGWTFENAVSVSADNSKKPPKYKTPDGEFFSLSQVAEHYGMSISGVASRFAGQLYKDWVKC
jgi:AraC-like DNA-binding protein